MTTFSIQETYGVYTLTATHCTNGGLLSGCISADRQIQEPMDSINRLHGGPLNLDHYPGGKRTHGIPHAHWAYRFFCNDAGDVNIVNGIIIYDMSRFADTREWTFATVLQHLKDCINA